MLVPQSCIILFYRLSGKSILKSVNTHTSHLPFLFCRYKPPTAKRSYPADKYLHAYTHMYPVAQVNRSLSFFECSSSCVCCCYCCYYRAISLACICAGVLFLFCLHVHISLHSTSFIVQSENIVLSKELRVPCMFIRHAAGLKNKSLTVHSRDARSWRFLIQHLFVVLLQSF